MHPLSKKDDSIAQSVEHNTFNVGVLGSSPSRVTSFSLLNKNFDSIAQSVEHNTFNVGVLGSSPSRVTFFLPSLLHHQKFNPEKFSSVELTTTKPED